MCTVIDPANRRNSHAALLVLPSSHPRQFSPPFDSGNRRNSHATLSILPHVVRPRHSPHHLRELPPSGPHLPRSRLRQYSPPFDSANRRNSHATLSILRRRLRSRWGPEGGSSLRWCVLSRGRTTRWKNGKCCVWVASVDWVEWRTELMQTTVQQMGTQGR